MNLSNSEINEEKKYLNDTINVIKTQISELGQQLYEKEEKIMEFKKFIWNSKSDMDPTEMKTMINASDLEVALATYKSNHLQNLYRIQDHPYFGSITFKEENEKAKKIYIGITHVEDEEKEKYLVYDWRAPVCSMFYDYELGKAKYLAPEGIIEGEITNKRQFNIKDGKLVRVFDNNINIDDELLQEVLTQEANDKMKNIVNTIQQEQNAIIRNVTDNNLIVQGIAGSGKTSVALHRIAFLLYKIKNLNSNNVLIFSPNQIFTEYISNVLPELGEANTLQTTFNDFLSSNLSEFKSVETFTSFIERYYKYEETNKKLVSYKQSDQIIKDIDNFVSFFLSKVNFMQDIDMHEFSISKDELNYLLKDRYEKLLLLDRIDAIAEKICQNYYMGKHSKKKQIISLLNKALNVKIDFKNIYKEFFHSPIFINSYCGNISDFEISKAVSGKEIKFEDACILVYLKGMFEGFDYLGSIKEVVVDEAQDYNILQFVLLRKIFKKSNFTILGDINQTINPYYKYDSLENIAKVFANDSLYLELTKTYRSTPEIIEHTNKILGLTYVSAIRRENNREVLFRDEDNNLQSLLVSDIEYLQKCGFTIAIITKTDNEALDIYNILKDFISDVNLLSNNTKVFNKKMVVVPSYMAKGLEFDAVVVYTKKDNKYREDEKYLYYVACTRAQHQLIIYNQN